MKTLEQFNSLSIDNFKLWLMQSLQEVHDKDQGVRYHACDFRDLGIFQGESYLERIGDIYTILHTDAQTRLNEALCLLISETELDTVSFDIMDDLIFLFFYFNKNKKIGYAESLLLTTVIPDGPWGQNYPALIYDCASVMMHFDESSEPVLLEKHRNAGKNIKNPEVA